VSASVHGPEPERAGLAPTSKRLIRSLAIAAMLLVAAFAATPAGAQEVPVDAPPTEATPVDPPVTDATPPPIVTDSPPPVTVPVDRATPADISTDPVVVDNPTPVDPVADSTQDGDHVSTRQPSHSGDGSGPAQGASTPASTPASGDDTTTVDAVAPSSDGYPGAWLGQDTFVVDKADDPQTGAAASYRGPLSGLFVLRGASRASRAIRLEAKARRTHEIAKVSEMGGPPGSGHQLPGQNPFLNLLSGPGGAAAGLALASIFAVLGVAFVLPRARSRTFRMPTVSWRPLAYVPPIELPG
jgi:hypothetical protein